MKKWFIIILALIILTPRVFSLEEPSADFDNLKCDRTGVLSFRVNYEWNGYKGGYVSLPDVKVSDKGTIVKGFWYKFENKEYPVYEIKLNLPTAYFFSNKDSLKEGVHEITIDYAISKSNYERFKKSFTGSVTCPEQIEIVKEVKHVVPEAVEEPVGNSLEKPKALPTGEPPLIDKKNEAYINYYVIGLLIIIFVISTFITEKFYKKYPENKKKGFSKGTFTKKD